MSTPSKPRVLFFPMPSRKRPAPTHVAGTAEMIAGANDGINAAGANADAVIRNTTSKSRAGTSFFSWMSRIRLPFLSVPHDPLDDVGHEDNDDDDDDNDTTTTHNADVEDVVATATAAASVSGEDTMSYMKYNQENEDRIRAWWTRHVALSSSSSTSSASLVFSVQHALLHSNFSRAILTIRGMNDISFDSVERACAYAPRCIQEITYHMPDQPASLTDVILPVDQIVQAYVAIAFSTQSDSETTESSSVDPMLWANQRLQHIPHVTFANSTERDLYIQKRNDSLYAAGASGTNNDDYDNDNDSYDSHSNETCTRGFSPLSQHVHHISSGASAAKHIVQRTLNDLHVSSIVSFLSAMFGDDTPHFMQIDGKFEVYDRTSAHLSRIVLLFSKLPQITHTQLRHVMGLHPSHMENAIIQTKTKQLCLRVHPVEMPSWFQWCRVQMRGSLMNANDQQLLQAATLRAPPTIKGTWKKQNRVVGGGGGGGGDGSAATATIATASTASSSQQGMKRTAPSIQSHRPVAAMQKLAFKKRFV